LNKQRDFLFSSFTLLLFSNSYPFFSFTHTSTCHLEQRHLDRLVKPAEAAAAEVVVAVVAAALVVDHLLAAAQLGEEQFMPPPVPPLCLEAMFRPWG
jgi:hypothetical protein